MPASAFPLYMGVTEVTQTHLSSEVMAHLAADMRTPSPRPFRDVSSFVAHLADEYPHALPSAAKEKAQFAIAELQSRMAVELIHSVLPQAQELAEVVWKVGGLHTAEAAYGDHSTGGLQ